MTIVGYQGDTWTRVGYDEIYVEYLRDTWAFKGHGILVGHMGDIWTHVGYVSTWSAPNTYEILEHVIDTCYEILVGHVILNCES